MNKRDENFLVSKETVVMSRLRSEARRIYCKTKGLSLTFHFHGEDDEANFSRVSASSFA